jgi:branched-chain amino acid transport system substrate-binding protein
MPVDQGDVSAAKPSVRHGLTRRQFAAAAGALALSGGATSKALAQDKPFRIGMVAPLSGPAAPFGIEYAEGARVYVKAWNERGGHKGKPVEFDLVDDESTSVGSVNAFKKHASNADTNLIWLASASSAILAVKPLASEYKVPIICGGIVDAIGIPADPYLFKVAAGTQDFQKALVLWAKQKGFKRIAMMHATDGYGQAEQVTIKRLAGEAGIEVVAIETYQNSDTNFTTQLTKLRAARPDVVYIASAGAPAILIFKQYRQLNLPFPVTMTQATISRAFFDGVGGPQQVKGVHMATNLGNLGASVGGDAARFFGEMEKALGKKGTLFNSFGWDHGILTEWALANSNGSRQGIRDALDRAKDVPAINGPFTFTAENHIGQDYRGLTMAEYDGTAFVPAK